MCGCYCARLSSMMWGGVRGISNFSVKWQLSCLPAFSLAVHALGLLVAAISSPFIICIRGLEHGSCCTSVCGGKQLSCGAIMHLRRQVTVESCSFYARRMKGIDAWMKQMVAKNTGDCLTFTM